MSTIIAIVILLAPFIIASWIAKTFRDHKTIKDLEKRSVGTLELTMELAKSKKHPNYQAVLRQAKANTLTRRELKELARLLEHE